MYICIQLISSIKALKFAVKLKKNMCANFSKKKTVCHSNNKNDKLNKNNLKKKLSIENFQKHFVL